MFGLSWPHAFVPIVEFYYYYGVRNTYGRTAMGYGASNGPRTAATNTHTLVGVGKCIGDRICIFERIG